MKYMEVESKHPADNIKLSDFCLFCKGKNPLRYKEISGYDHFYSNPYDTESFWRHRVGPGTNQATFKRKTKGTDSRIRVERNIDLAPNMDKDDVGGMVSESGYVYSASIFKNCFIFDYDNHTLVFYICYDANMKELGRYLEIEAKEDYPWKNEQEAWGMVTVIEKICKPLGISPATRVDKSLYELYGKGIK